MRDFSWRYFYATGEIDAYLLYKEYETVMGFKEVSATRSEEDLTDED